MSRSYRKPIYKDGGHQRKKNASRAYRRVCKQITDIWTKEGDPYYGFCDCYECLMTPDSPVYPHPYEITDPYDICDWRMYYFKKDYTDIENECAYSWGYCTTKDTLKEYIIACRK